MKEPHMTRYGWLIGLLGMALGAAMWWAVLTGRLPAWILLW